MNATAVISLDTVSFSYGGPMVLEDICLEVASGEFLGVVGPNAGGKSTLLKIILGLLTPTSGRVTVLGRAPAEGRAAIGYVPQKPTFQHDFPISVEQAVLMGRLGKTAVLGGYSENDTRAVEAAMAETEIADLSRRQLSTLSGGQLQRVMVARALTSDPRILILDEPTSNIDMRVETDIFDLLRRLKRRMTIIVVSHDIAFISQYVTRVACLNRTLMCHQTSVLDGKLVTELYGAPVRMVDHMH